MVILPKMVIIYFDPANIKLVRKSHDKIIHIIIVATYNFEDVKFNKRTL